MGAMASQIISLTIVYSTVYSSADQRKHQSSASLAFVRGIRRWFPRTNGQLGGKCYHLMMSSWFCISKTTCCPAASFSRTLCKRPWVCSAKWYVTCYLLWSKRTYMTSCAQELLCPFVHFPPNHSRHCLYTWWVHSLWNSPGLLNFLLLILAFSSFPGFWLVG